MAFPTSTVEIAFDTDPTAPYVDAVTAQSPQIYYRLGEPSGLTAVDASGNGRGGTYVAVTYAQAGALSGDADTAVLLDGVTSCISRAAAPALSNLAPGWAIEAWVKRRVTGAKHPIRSMTGAAGNVYVYIDTDDKVKVSSAIIGSISTVTIDTGWHHILVAYEGAVSVDSVARIYVDGVDVTSVVNPGANFMVTNETSGQLLVGKASIGGGLFDGVIDEFAQYGVNLSALNAAAHYYAAAVETPTVWTDVTDHYIGGGVQRGRQFELDTLQGATGKAVFDNTDRAFDPTNTAGPYYGKLLPLRRLRKRWTINAVTYTRFLGLIESFPLVWEMPSEARAELTLVDGFEQLSRADISGQSWSAELAGARINHVLDAALWPKALRNIDPGRTTVQASAFAAGTPQSALSHIQDVAGSDLGYFFISADGLATFHDRQHRVTATTSATSQATFGDAAGQLPYEDITPEYSPDRLLNDVTSTASGGTPQTTVDGASNVRYFNRPAARTILASADADADLQSKNLVARYKDPVLRIEKLVLKPAKIAGADGDSLWAQVLSRDIGDRITVAITPPGGGSPISLECFIEQVSDDYPGDVEWTTTWQLSPAEQGICGWILGDAIHSVLGVTTVPAG